MKFLEGLDWDILLSGLIGAFIGGVASIIGGLWATNKNIKAQNELLFKQEQKDINKQKLITRASAKTIHSDMLSTITEAHLVASSKKMPSGVPVGFHYSNHITNLISTFGSNELALVYKVYGHIERLKIDFQKYNEQSAFDPSRRDCGVFIKEIFGDNESAITRIPLGDTTNFDYLQYMKDDYKQLFIKLMEMY